MDTLERIKKVINYLIYQEVAENSKELSEILGYTKSSFSQIVNGKVPLSEKFIKKLCSLDNNINEVWLKTGEGDMFNPISTQSSNIVIPKSVWKIIQQQADSLITRDKQINELIMMLKQKQ